MMESLFEELPTISDEDNREAKERGGGGINCRRSSLIASSLPVVRKIVSRKIFHDWQTEASDLVQTVALRLWKWQDKFRDKSGEMSAEEWQSFAARTAYNEINRHFARTSAQKSVPLDAAAEIPSSKASEGNSEAEIYSLINHFWQEICRLTVRQRRALLLHSQELVIYFLQAGNTDDDLAGILDLTPEEWAEIKLRLPLSDAQIASLQAAKNRGEETESKPQSIKKARHEARLKLRRLK